MQTIDRYDVIVVGAGHAGCEAALAAARMGNSTLLVTMNMDLIAQMPCNPSIGGPGKGHLVREIDALGGEMAQATDRNFIQVRMLNMSKGPAVQALRAQADKRLYSLAMKHALETTDNLTTIQATVVKLTTSGGRVNGVVTQLGRTYSARAVVVTTGTFLNGRILSGEHRSEAGRAGEFAAHGLSACLQEAGLTIRRLTTNTPPRVDARTVDFSAAEPQYGSDEPLFFSFRSAEEAYARQCACLLPSRLNPIYPVAHQTAWRPQLTCHLIRSTPDTERIVRENLHRSPIASGLIEASGPRYCPSFEEKIVHFPHHGSHQLFLEPEGWLTTEVYCQGLFTGMPEEVQVEMLHSIPALRSARITRPGYAIEYDYVPSWQIGASLEARAAPGLFLAGQVNGTSGYEEAAAQGLMAGINAARCVQDRPPVVLGRDQAYIGVLIDDLVTKDITEPYRIMTSRAEYRLLLRQDNADLRLSPLGHEIGLLPDACRERTLRKRGEVDRLLELLAGARIRPGEHTNRVLADHGIAALTETVSALQFLRRPEAPAEVVSRLVPDFGQAPVWAREQAEIEAKYAGYIEKQRQQVKKLQRVETRPIPADVDYRSMQGLRLEACEKLSRHRPATLGQASRLSGVSPADLSVLMVHLERLAPAPIKD